MKRLALIALAAMLSGCGITFTTPFGSRVEVNPGQLQKPNTITYTSGTIADIHVEAGGYGGALGYRKFATMTVPVCFGSEPCTLTVPTIATSTTLGFTSTAGTSLGDFLVIGNPGPVTVPRLDGLVVEPLKLDLGQRP